MFQNPYAPQPKNNAKSNRTKIDKKTKELLFNEQRGKCNYCGHKADISYFDLDHKKPVTRNGSDRANNLQLLCGPCNKRKGNMTDGEFRRKYKLTAAREANGPPGKVIPQTHFEAISEASKKKSQKTARRRRKADDFWGIW